MKDQPENKKEDFSKKESYNELFDTTKESFKEMRKKIKEKDFDLDNQDENGKTVLMNLVEQRANTEQMWVLLDYGADPNVQDKDKKTALHYACSGPADRKDIIICLLLFGIDPEIADDSGSKALEDYKEDLSSIREKVDEVKREFISLTRKRRKFLKYIFDEMDELQTKLLNEYNLGAFYQKINKESNEEAVKDAHNFIEAAKLYKNPFEDSISITFEEFIVAICRIVKVHGMKIIDEFINRYKKVRVKNVQKPAAEEEGEGKDENKES